MNDAKAADTEKPIWSDDDDMPTLEDEFGCDPWGDENFGKHPASREM